MGEGTFSEVIKCRHITDGTLVAIKCMKDKFNRLARPGASMG